MARKKSYESVLPKEQKMEHVAYISKPTEKEKALEFALKEKFNAKMERQILYFFVKDDMEKEAVVNWLHQKYGKSIPFSFGIKISKTINFTKKEIEETEFDEEFEH